jgi:hypothetical protein
VRVLGCVGINELGAASLGIVIYPNPNNGEFVVETATELSLTLSNGLGQVIRTFDVSPLGGHKVHVKDLAQGIYFITGQKDGVPFNQKIVVTK